MEWRLVVRVGREYGWIGEDKKTLGVFKVLDLLNTAYHVRREKLLAQFRTEQQPPEGSE